jgi:catechol 2,3-dioxygenase-like lactoylglutathione lyase family enzyme
VRTADVAIVARFSLVAVDCPDPLELARFYESITGWELDDADEGVWDGNEDWVQLRSTGGATLAFQRSPGFRPPVWPSDEHPQQMHLDFDVPDLDEAEIEILALGARKAEVQPGTTFRVYIDPAGHPFCLVLGHLRL